MMNIKYLIILTFLSIVYSYAIEITDYKTINNTYQKSYINGDLNMKNGNQDQSSFNLNLNADYEYVKTTAPFSFDIKLDGISNLSRGANKNDRFLKGYEIKSIVHFDKYILNDNTFMYITKELGFRKRKEQNKTDKLLLNMGVGFGFGRMYDSTTLVKAIQIIDDLLKYKLIDRILSNAGYVKLAQLINKENSLKSRYGLSTYKKYWYRDIEQLLKDDGVLKNKSLGAFGIVRIDEILDIKKMINKIHGYKLRFGISKYLSHYSDQNINPSTNAEFEYALPLGISSQIYENLKFIKILNDKIIDFSITNNFSLIYEISSVIDWENKWDLEYIKNKTSPNYYEHKLSTSFIYYLGGQLNFKTTLLLNKNSNESDWNQNLIASIVYRLK